MAYIDRPDFIIEKKGYNTDQVDTYVEDLEAKVKHLKSENAELEQKLETARRMIRRFSGEENALRQSIADSKRAAVTMLEDTKKRSDTLLDSTRSSCGDIISDLDRKIGEKMDSVDRMRLAVADFKDKLFEMYSQHIGLIEDIAEKAETFDYEPDYSPIAEAVEKFESDDTTSYEEPKFNDYPQESIFKDAETLEPAIDVIDEVVLEEPVSEIEEISEVEEVEETLPFEAVEDVTEDVPAEEDDENPPFEVFEITETNLDPSLNDVEDIVFNMSDVDDIAEEVPAEASEEEAEDVPAEDSEEAPAEEPEENSDDAFFKFLSDFANEDDDYSPESDK